jgi:hypothetical protein
MPYANISIIIYTRSWKFHHVNENYVILNFLKITNWNIGIQLGKTKLTTLSEQFQWYLIKKQT